MLDEVALLVERAAAGIRTLSPWPRLDCWYSAEIRNCIVKIFEVISHIGDDAAQLRPLQAICARAHIASMAGRRDKTNRQAEGIDSGIDVGV